MMGTMTADAEHTLRALHRFFLLSYREEAQRRLPGAWIRLPLAVSSHVDVVAVNGGHRAHFLFSSTDREGHGGRIHDVTVAGEPADPDAEKAFVARQYRTAGETVHFIVRPPFEERFERVGRLARESAVEHAEQLGVTA